VDVRGSLALVALVACTETPRAASAPAPPAVAVAPAPAPAPGAPEAKTAPVTAVASPVDNAGIALPKPKPERRPGAWANLDPDDDYTLGPPDPIEDCEGELKKAGVTFAKATLAVHAEKKKKSTVTCGAPQVVTYIKGPGNIAYNAPPLLTCAMAAALASFEKVVQEEAKAVFKSPVARIEHLGTYNCREMANYPGWVSEHAYANAIDLARFVLKDGRTIDVERDFDMGDGEPKKPAGLFLRLVSRRANDEDVFSHVLTPFWDALHKNHFHLDLSRYRTDGTRPHD
jgi:hypothetical protein